MVRVVIRLGSKTNRLSRPIGSATSYISHVKVVVNVPGVGISVMDILVVVGLLVGVVLLAVVVLVAVVAIMFVVVATLVVAGKVVVVADLVVVADTVVGWLVSTVVLLCLCVGVVVTVVPSCMHDERKQEKSEFYQKLFETVLI